LFAGHRVQSKTRCDFRRTHRTVIDDQKLNDEQNQENHDSDHIISADDKFAESLNHRAGSRFTGISFREN